MAAVLVTSTPVLAENYPSKPITLVVPFAAGSGTDQVARAMAASMQTAWPGTPVVVENRPGANGFIAALAVAKASPDGYTLFVTTNTTQSANPHLFKKLPYDPVADFAPIAALARGSTVLVVPPSSPYKTVAELIQAGKKHELSYGAANSSGRVSAEMLGQMTGAKVLYVPYKSSPQALTDLMGGQLDFMFADAPTATPMVRAGKLRAIGYAGATRSEALTNVPTIMESGIKGYELYYWVAVYAPKSTARDVIQRLNEVLVAGAKTPAIGSVFNNAGLAPYTTTAQGLANLQLRETEKWGKVIRAAGIQPE